MTLHLPDQWLWDFWFAQDGPDYHLFYLQASRSLGKEELRHWHTSIGHAVSRDLKNWTVLPDALHPSPTGYAAFDDFTTWTGSIIQHEGLWYLFYTGTSHAEKGLVQRIGLATSQDLINWEKHPHNPILCADPRWYEVLDQNIWPDQAWRDPYVFRHPQSDEFHMFITARCKSGSPDGRGVIGHGRSQDLVHWEILPPLTTPGDFAYLEVPQWVSLAGKHYLLFCVTDSVFSQKQVQQGIEPLTGTYYMHADNPLGPFTSPVPASLYADKQG
ncbi:MAG: glycosyl hydrolase family 32, partial [Anaerolineae bacterium]|nr:glycosyl hydrolase family 32 [Anaerolineae bacterium]